MRSIRARVLAILVGVVAAVICQGRLHAAAPPPPPTDLVNLLRPEMIDPTASKAIVAGTTVESKPNAATALADPTNRGGWDVVIPHDQTQLPISYLVAFREPIEAGTVHFGGTISQLSILKPGAAYPPDPAQANQWQEIAVPPSQSGGGVATLLAGTKTRALLLTAAHPWRSATLQFVRIYSSRLGNVTPLAKAYADSEYTQYGDFGPPTIYSSSYITHGGGSWVNTGKDGLGRIPRVPITDLDPAWVVLSWDDPQTINGLWMADDFEQVRIEAYNGPRELNPRAGTDAEWDVIPNQTPVVGPDRLISFPPITTRGLRLTVMKSHNDRVCRIDGLHIFTAVKGDAAAVIAPTAVADAPPPVSIPYTMGFDGEATMVINGPDGRRIRNLFARRNQSPGDHLAGWDLKDEQGRVMPPGAYEFKTISHPPLHLKYELTAYPNVSENSPVNPPWHTSMSGPGGWLADHTSNLSGTAGGEYVFFGAPVAESGVSLICCDLTGRKLWAIPSFAGFTGAYHAASTPDGKTVYVAAPGGAMQIDARSEIVWAVDVASHTSKEIARLLPTSSRQRGIRSMAARNGKLYIAVGAEEDSFAAAAGPDDVDIEQCVPRYAAAHAPRFDHDVPPNQRDDFLRLFRLTGQPAGGHALTYIESLPGKSPRRYVALLFNRPVPIGSAIYPQPTDPGVKVKLSVLKPNAPYPPNPGDPSQWIPFSSQGKLAWDVATAPPNTRTRALRITFSRGDAAEDDLLGADDSAEFKVGQQDPNSLTLKDPVKDKEDVVGGLSSDPAGSWVGKLEGLKIISRRFENVSGLATVEVNSGQVSADGVWDAKRSKALSDSDPGIYVMKWKGAQALRGLGFKEIDGRRTEIDVYTGPDDKPVDMNSPTAWKHVKTFMQDRRQYYWPDATQNSAARYLDGYVDFGEEIKTRAVRFRVCEQWQDNNQGRAGPRWDVAGKMDSTRCRIFGVAAMKYVGGEGDAVDPRAFQRIETLNPETGKIEAEVPLAKPVKMAFNAQGVLCAVCGHDIGTVDVATGKYTPLSVGDLIDPRAFAIDKAGNFYVFDEAPARRNIRVYSPVGKYVRSIGAAGGYRAGAWDPNRLQSVTSLVIDSEEKLWAVDSTYFPKRISLWSLDGTWKKDFLGNTQYGGAGVLDPKDKTRLFYGPLEFAIDWTTGHSHLKNLTWLGDARAGEQPIYVNGRNYMVSRYDPPGPSQDYATVYLYEKDHLKAVAAMGHASQFPPLTRPELQSQLGNPVLFDSTFVWMDRNGDGEVQADEVVLRPRSDKEQPLTRFNNDLGIQSSSIRFQVKSFLPNGTPIYEIQELPGLRGIGNIYRLNDGNFEGKNNGINGLFAADGKPIWTYPNEGLTTFALSTATPYRPEQVVCEFGWIGHETAHAGDLGEFTVVHTNVGVWNVWTADGLLAGSIFADQRVPGARGWSMPEHERGMSMDHVSPGQEHFSGYFCKTEDNHYYAIAGHNHISLVEVLGMDGFKRSAGKIEIKPADVVNTEAWAQARQRQQIYQRTPVLDCYHIETPLPTNCDLRKWDTVAADFGEKDKGRMTRGATLHAAWDSQYLYLCYEVLGLGPLKNSGEQWDRLFKTGASVDIQIGVDSKSPRDRKAPAPGDKRLLLTFVGEKPMAVLYDAVVPGTLPDATWKAVSPVGQVSFDRVVQLNNVRMAHTGDDNRYVLEAAIPLEVLGLKPVDDLRLKMDWGVLSTDTGGNAVMQRLYWSNGATGIIADVPSEAQLHPDLWGYALFHDRSRHPEGPSQAIRSKEGDTVGGKKPSVKDIERELNGEK